MLLKRSSLRALSLVLGITMGLLLLEGLARLAHAIGYGSQVVAENEHRDAELLKQIRAGNSPLPAHSRTILVLGDSMAFSPGVPKSRVWSTLLADQLRVDVDPRVVVVNAAIPGSNTYEALLLTRELLPKLHPEVVLFMYNLNDVYGTHGSSDRSRESALPMPPPPTAARPPIINASSNEDADLDSINGTPTLLSRIISTLKRESRALQALLPHVNIQLKARGILVPGTLYHHMTTEAYKDNFEGWKNARKELAELDAVCHKFGARLLLYVIPDFDVLKYDHSLEDRRILGDYARSIGVPIGFGYEKFQGRSAEELAISPFDSHPNAKANGELAKVIAEWLKSVKALPDKPR